MDSFMKAWIALISLAIVGTIASILVGIWFDGDLAMRLWLSVMATSVIPLFVLSPFS